MKRVIAFLLLIATACLLCGFQQNQVITARRRVVGGGGGTTVTFNSSTVSGNTSGATSLVVVYSGSVVSGNAFVVMVGFQGATQTVTSVCDGTGTGQCIGGSTYNSNPVLRNSTNSIQVWYTCNWNGTSGGGNLTITLSGNPGFFYVTGGGATGNTTTGTGCNDGYKDNSGASGTAYSTGAMTATTNAHDLLFSFAMNDTGGTYTAGTDGQGNTMTIRANDGGVSATSSFNETATAAFNSTITGVSTHWEMAEFAVK